EHHPKRLHCAQGERFMIMVRFVSIGDMAVGEAKLRCCSRRISRSAAASERRHPIGGGERTDPHVPLTDGGLREDTAVRLVWIACEQASRLFLRKLCKR